jgi:hypothetical protein
MGKGYSPMTEAQRAAARLAIQAGDDLIPQSFVEKNGAGADIVFANTSTNVPFAGGVGIYPQFEGAPPGRSRRAHVQTRPGSESVCGLLA